MTKKLYQIIDNGIRCFTVPCFSWDVIDTANNLTTKVSKVTCTKALATQVDIEKLNKILYTNNVIASGTFKTEQILKSPSKHIVFEIDNILGGI